MSDNLSSRAKRGMMKAVLKQPKQLKAFEEGPSFKNSSGTSAEPTNNMDWSNEGFAFSDEETDNNNVSERGMQKKECRICHEEDFAENMEAPCECNGSLKFAHRNCIQRWCNEKRHTLCEICLQPYIGGYVVAEEETVVEINENLGNHEDQEITRVLTTVENNQHLVSIDGYDEDCGTPARLRMTIFRVFAIISGVLILVKHALEEVEQDDHGSGGIVSLVFYVRLMAFMAPIYCIIWIGTLIIRWIEHRKAVARLAARRNARVVASTTIAHRRSMRPPGRPRSYTYKLT